MSKEKGPWGIRLGGSKWLEDCGDIKESITWSFDINKADPFYSEKFAQDFINSFGYPNVMYEIVSLPEEKERLEKEMKDILEYFPIDQRVVDIKHREGKVISSFDDIWGVQFNDGTRSYSTTKDMKTQFKHYEENTIEPGNVVIGTQDIMAVALKKLNEIINDGEYNILQGLTEKETNFIKSVIEFVKSNR